MTATNSHHEGDTHFPTPDTCEGVGCCDNDRPEVNDSGEAESHCGGGCCADDEDSGCESDVDNYEDSCCGGHEDNEIHEEPVHEAELQERCCSVESFKAESEHSSCCKPVTNGDDEEPSTPGKCIPDGVNGCQRAALLKSTCCGSNSNSTPGTPSESHDPGFLTDSSDAILLKELKSIIQEHSTHHHHNTGSQSGLRKRTNRHQHSHSHDDHTREHHSHRSHSRHRTTSATSVACSVANSLFTRVLQRLAVFAKGQCCCVANQTVVPIPVCFPTRPHGDSNSHLHIHGDDHSRDYDHKPEHGHPHELPSSPRSPSSIKLAEIIQTSIDLAERGAGVERRKMIMSIEGMDCPSCAVRVTKALNTIPSVTQPKVNTFSAEATLMYDIATISPDEIAQRTTGLTGFICKFVQELREEDLTKTLWVSVPAKWDDNELPTGVSIRSRRLMKNKGNLLEVQYDSTIIQPRNVVAAFEPWDGEYIPLEQVREPSQASKDLWLLSRRTTLSAIATIPILVFAWAPLPKRPILYGSISLVLATFVQFYIALPLYRSSFRSLLQRVIDMDLLVAGSTSTAYIYSIISFAFLAAGKPIDESFFETSALLVTLIMLGRTVSAFARRRTTSALDAVDALQVRMVNLVENGGVRTIPAELVHVGDILQISPDSTIPTDGVIRNGVTQVDESSLTGESKPAEKQRGSPVTAGTLNLSGSIEITASRSMSENTIAGISRLMHDAQESRIPIQDLADQVAAYFAPVVLALGLVTFLTWIFIGKFGQDKTTEKASIGALMKMIAVLVVSCPCAVSLCVPMVVVIAVSVAARKGVLFKSIESVQFAKDTTAVLFDKTGTLTEGNLSVAEFHPFTDDAASLAYHLTKTSTHPVAKAITEHVLPLATSSTTAPKLGAVTSIAGQGLETKLGRRSLRGGNCRWLHLNEHPTVLELRQKSRTIFAITLDEEPVAIFGLTDKLRPGAGALVKWLAQRKVDVYVLSGDEPAVVESIAAQLGIRPDHAVGGCTPKSKADFVRNVQENRLSASARRSKRPANVMFVGDGTNDIVALTQADTGVSIGSGTDVAISAADVIMLNPTNIHKSVETIFRVSESSFRRIVWNFMWSFLYNLFAILLAGGAFVKFSIRPEYAGLGEMVSILPVIFVAWTMVFV